MSAPPKALKGVELDIAQQIPVAIVNEWAKVVGKIDDASVLTSLVEHEAAFNQFIGKSTVEKGLLAYKKGLPELIKSVTNAAAGLNGVQFPSLHTQTATSMGKIYGDNKSKHRQCKKALALKELLLAFQGSSDLLEPSDTLKHIAGLYEYVLAKWDVATSAVPEDADEQPMEPLNPEHESLLHLDEMEERREAEAAEKAAEAEEQSAADAAAAAAAPVRTVSIPRTPAPPSRTPSSQMTSFQPSQARAEAAALAAAAAGVTIGESDDSPAERDVPAASPPLSEVQQLRDSCIELILQLPYITLESEQTRYTQLIQSRGKETLVPWKEWLWLEVQRSVVEVQKRRDAKIAAFRELQEAAQEAVALSDEGGQLLAKDVHSKHQLYTTFFPTKTPGGKPMVYKDMTLEQVEKCLKKLRKQIVVLQEESTARKVKRDAEKAERQAARAAKKLAEAEAKIKALHERLYKAAHKDFHRKTYNGEFIPPDHEPVPGEDKKLYSTRTDPDLYREYEQKFASEELIEEEIARIALARAKERFATKYDKYQASMATSKNSEDIPMWLISVGEKVLDGIMPTAEQSRKFEEEIAQAGVKLATYNAALVKASHTLKENDKAAAAAARKADAAAAKRKRVSIYPHPDDVATLKLIGLDLASPFLVAALDAMTQKRKAADEANKKHRKDEDTEDEVDEEEAARRKRAKNLQRASLGQATRKINKVRAEQLAEQTKSVDKDATPEPTQKKKKNGPSYTHATPDMVPKMAFETDEQAAARRAQKYMDDQLARTQPQAAAAAASSSSSYRAPEATREFIEIDDVDPLDGAVGGDNDVSMDYLAGRGARYGAVRRY